jgi:peptide/nickel transport system substrate-binding protein
VIVQPGGVFAAEKPKYGGTLRMSALNIKAFDPARTASYKTNMMISFIYEGLVTGDQEKMRKDPNFHRDVGGYTPPNFIKGALAESWKWQDSTTLIFHLRKGVKFQNKPPVNGREFVADDVTFSFKRYRTSKRLDQYVLNHVDSITAKDKYTIVFKLKEPYSQAISHMGLGLNHFIVPHEVVEKEGNLSNWETAIGTGPFLLDNFSPGNALTYKKNPEYWDKGKPIVDEIKALIIPDVETQLAALRTGKIDIVDSIQPIKVSSLKETNPSLQFRKYLFVPYAIYMRTDKKPFNDIRVRKALAMAIDRKKIADRYWGGDAEILAHPYPPPWEEVYTPLNKLGEAAEIYSYNPEKAKKLLREAGYPNGFKTKLTYTLGYGRVWAQQMELVKEYFSKIGVDLQLVLKEYMAYYTTAHKGKYEGMGAGLHGQSDPLGSARYFLPGSTMNKSHVNDPKYNEMVRQLKLAYDDRAEFDAIAREINRYVVGQAWNIAMPSPYIYVIWQPWVKNFYGAIAAMRYDRGHAFTDVWVDESLRK